VEEVPQVQVAIHFLVPFRDWAAFKAWGRIIPAAQAQAVGAGALALRVILTAITQIMGAQVAQEEPLAITEQTVMPAITGMVGD
jgi:hypothetical protein